ncbi:sulfite exporter TauE/SafE family protein [Sungkyunkwania multivorans]|uniref:Sulfite exporter TauE/SafE family protein n=1 Tax=Sungkyunkwania multivorans TaxID=1173618 RepID=A0ABW3D489_9FLAO
MLFSAFILGLLGSLHCIGMCGPIAFMLPVDRHNPKKKLFQISIYHFGRILAYSIIGLLFGLLGKSFQLFGLQQQLSIGVGVLMIFVVLIPQHRLSRFSLSKPLFKIVSKVKSELGAALKKRTPDTFITIGFLNGFLPCGLVYMAVFGAVALGDTWQGSMYMILFGLGTIPLMTSAIYASNFLNGKARQHIRKAIPVFVMIIGVLFIVRGLGLGIPYISPKPVVELVSAELECH